ncbi:hypothetical protein V0R48_15160 [Pseudomonas alcaligenes]|uniref:hypothetical protein n=1 Tax=Aquipseudomonas alcaligenes TaxID=43263 RepID=UPI002E7B67CC|nr:hypothetical protein [Pseudomonas alcaligenes]MEE1950322.1 hypothetical protein [Pseudomonas alcaligenes]
MEDFTNEDGSDELALIHIREIIKNRNISSSIQLTLKGLHEALKNNNININATADFIIFKKEIRSGKISRTDLDNLNFESIFSPKKADREASIALECIMLLACASIAEENDSIMIAWNLQSRANQKYGLYCGLTDHTKSAHAERGRKANEARMKNSEKEYNLLLELIREMKPPRGWKSKADAANQVGKQIFSQKIKDGLKFKSEQERIEKENDLIGMVLESIIANKEVQAAYNSKPLTKHQ